MNAFRPDSVIGRPTRRVEGAAKVTGQARYGADQPVAGVLPPRSPRRGSRAGGSSGSTRADWRGSRASAWC